jgi:hypothetical protein
MIRHKLPNKMKSATVAEPKLFHQLNNPKAVFSSSKKYYAKKRFPVTSNLRYMHGVLNVDEIKN